MRTKAITVISFLMISMVTLGGCTHVYKLDDAFMVTYPDNQPHDLRVELRLTTEFATYQWEMSRMGDTFLMPLGQALTNNAKALSNALFDEVVVVLQSDDPSRFQTSSTSQADAILTPKVTVVERAAGSWAFAKVSTKIGVEWALTNRTGTLVWLKTIQGSGEANAGNLFTHHGNAKKQAERALADLYGKTYEAMIAAPEIKSLAKRSP